jgi:lipoprotein-anchoring transpeptidase ErfK/SrfK
LYSSHDLEGMGAMRKAMRYVFSVIGIATLALVGSVNTSLAAVPTPPPVTAIEPASGEVVGVAHPVTVTFAEAVSNRSVAERSISFTSPATPSGAFTWLSDNVVQWNPDGFWPAHSSISVRAGGAKTEFQSGATVMGVADISAHTFTVSMDGEVMREMPASMGKPKFPTPTGRFSVLGKESVVVMDSRTIGIPLEDPEGYKLTVYNAVRITWGGVYVHGAPWSVGSQGYANVSHGCINLGPDNAAWFFDTVGIGDPIIVQA